MRYALGYGISVARRTWPVVTAAVLAWGGLALLARLAEHAVRSAYGPSGVASAFGTVGVIVLAVLMPLSVLGYVARVAARQGLVVAGWTVVVFVAEVLVLVWALWLGLWLTGVAPTPSQAWHLLRVSTVTVR